MAITGKWHGCHFKNLTLQIYFGKIENNGNIKVVIDAFLENYTSTEFKLSKKINTHFNE